MVGAAGAGLVNGGGKGAGAALPRATYSVERLEQGLHAVAHELRRIELVVLGSNDLPGLPQIVLRVYDIVVAGPATGTDGVVARPSDAGEAGGAPVAEHVSALDDAPHVGDRFEFVL